MKTKILAIAGLAISISAVEASASILEDWEAPALPPNVVSATLPAPWVRFSGPVNNIALVHDAGLGSFNQTEPLASPAGGNQYLFLVGTNTGISRLSGVAIEVDSTYTLQAAIGNPFGQINTHVWSLQLWADADGSGAFEGSGSDTFIGQEFGTSLTATNAAIEEWALNSFSFNSATTPELVGKQLIIFLNNFGDGSSSYDNVALVTPQPVPLPSTFWLLVPALGGLGAMRRRTV